MFELTSHVSQKLGTRPKVDGSGVMRVVDKLPTVEYINLPLMRTFVKTQANTRWPMGVGSAL